MAKYRKKPIVIEAVQYQIDNQQEIFDFTEGKAFFPIDSENDWVCKECGHKASRHGNCETLEGYHIICVGDYIIKGIKGEFYPCKPDIFKMTYEKVEE